MVTLHTDTYLSKKLIDWDTFYYLVFDFKRVAFAAGEILGY